MRVTRYVLHQGPKTQVTVNGEKMSCRELINRCTELSGEEFRAVAYAAGCNPDDPELWIGEWANNYIVIDFLNLIVVSS